jgi:hypothetical protein
MMSYERETTFNIERGGTTYSGRWRVERGMICVSSAYGSRKTQLGGLASNPNALAKTMLGELVNEWLKRQSPSEH